MGEQKSSLESISQDDLTEEELRKLGGFQPFQQPQAPATGSQESMRRRESRKSPVQKNSQADVGQSPQLVATCGTGFPMPDTTFMSCDRRVSASTAQPQLSMSQNDTSRVAKASSEKAFPEREAVTLDQKRSSMVDDDPFIKADVLPIGQVASEKSAMKSLTVTNIDEAADMKAAEARQSQCTTVREYSQEILRHTYGSIHSKISKLSQQFLSKSSSPQPRASDGSKTPHQQKSSQQIVNAVEKTTGTVSSTVMAAAAVGRGIDRGLSSSIEMTESERQASALLTQTDLNAENINVFSVAASEESVSDKLGSIKIEDSVQRATCIRSSKQQHDPDSFSCYAKPPADRPPSAASTRTELTDSQHRARAQVPDSDSFSKQQQQQDVFKQISDIIQSKEAPDKLTKKGEMICFLFKQRLFAKLEASGNLDEKSAEHAGVTAAKFAKWVEDILREAEERKKTSQKPSRTSAQRSLNSTHDCTRRDRDVLEEDTFVSATSSRESVPVVNEKPEVVKIQEVSETELQVKYGPVLGDRSRCEVFQFEGPDAQPVEVTHLMSDSNMKVMVVKKKNSNDSRWSSWLVEVGPDVTLESTTAGSDEWPKEETGAPPSPEEPPFKEEEVVKVGMVGGERMPRHGEWTWETLGLTGSSRYAWKSWQQCFQEMDVYTAGFKVPILRRQCVIQPADLLVEYPSYDLSFPGTIGGKRSPSIFEDREIIFPSPPHHDPSAPSE